MKEGIEQFKIEEQKEDLEKISEQLDKFIEDDKKLRQKGELADSTLLASVTRSDLTEEDLLILKKYIDEDWTYGNWQTYTDRVSKHIEENPKDKANNSRDIFRDWLAKKAHLQFGKEIKQEDQAKE